MYMYIKCYFYNIMCTSRDLNPVNVIEIYM